MATKHDRRSIRLPDWDYGNAGAYFVTICTHRRLCWLDCAPLSAVALSVWQDVIGASPYPGEVVVMPNHIHGIIWIAEAPVGAQQLYRPIEEHFESSDSTPLTKGSVAAPLHRPATRRRFGDGTHSGTLSTLVRTFKAASAKRINNHRETPGSPVWQRGYYERVLRDDRELNAAREYILDNPRKWSEDKHNPAVYSRPQRTDHRA